MSTKILSVTTKYLFYVDLSTWKNTFCGCICLCVIYNITHQVFIAKASYDGWKTIYQYQLNKIIFKRKLNVWLHIYCKLDVPTMKHVDKAWQSTNFYLRCYKIVYAQTVTVIAADSCSTVGRRAWLYVYVDLFMSLNFEFWFHLNAYVSGFFVFSKTIILLSCVSEAVIRGTWNFCL